MSSGHRTRHTARPRTGIVAVVASLIAVLLAAVQPLAASAAPPDGPDKLADFEAGLPAGWFVFNGGTSSVTPALTTVGDADAAARPGQTGDNGVLDVGFDVKDFGGFGQDVTALGGPQNWSTTEGLSFWFRGTNSGLEYQAEIADNRSDPATDTAERFDYAFVDNSTDWRRITIPWSDFTRATDFQPGGAPNDGLTLTEVWSWAIVLPLGAAGFQIDDVGVDNHVVDDFENLSPGGLPNGTDSNGLGVGWINFADPSGSTVQTAVETTPPAPLTTEFGPDNQALRVTMNVNSFAGVVHQFSNDALDTWVPQDWSAWEGLAFWLHGEGTGNDLFVDLIENRSPGSTTDDAERWSIVLKDDVAGWRYFEVPFSEFFRKDIGNGAPNDGFTRLEMHGWAFGAVSTSGQERTWYLDNMSLYGDAGSLPLTVSLTAGIVEVPEGDTGSVTVALNRTMVETDPAEVTVEYTTEEMTAPGSATPDRDYTPTSGTLTFVQGGPREQSFDIATFANPKFTGSKRIAVRLTDPQNAGFGTIRQSSVLILDAQRPDENLIDDFEGFPYLWDSSDDVTLDNRELTPGDPLAVPGQGDYEGVLEVTAPVLVEIGAPPSVCSKGEQVRSEKSKGKGRSGSNAVLTVSVLSSEVFDARTIDHTTVRLGEASETHVNKRTGLPRRHVSDVNRDGLRDLVFHFRARETGLGCDDPLVITGETRDGQPITSATTDSAPTFSRDFPIGQNWSEKESLSFWFYGSGSGEDVTLTLKDNRAPDPGPDGWDLVWSDEFNDPAGTLPNPENWVYEIGDVTPDGKFGWGNEERQYYTDDPENAQMDGNGNLVVTLKKAEDGQQCYYGPCEYTSARLITQDRQEFAYGRIETRLQVPDGGSGLWPAFWSLGTDITSNPWPGAGEIDIMEYVSRLPKEIFGTIHGPGYAGGQSFGNKVILDERVDQNVHTFAVEWSPELIVWYFNGEVYHTATPGDVSPNPWVFEKPFFLLLNMAIGGNFGGAIADEEDLNLPAELKVDYVRVYQGPDTAERFETTFVDEVAGWQKVTVPLTEFTRSADQPAGAPDDGLGLDEVWGYGFALPGGIGGGSLLLDQVRTVPQPPPTEVVVANLSDSGPGSLRAAIARVAEGGTVTFDPGLAGGTVQLTAPLTVDKDVTVDGSAAPGLSLSGQDFQRVLVLNAGATATFAHLTMRDGYGFQLGGAVINNGDLTLDHVTVTDSSTTTDAGDFWQGGGGIYSGEGASLRLVDSTVSNNSSGWSGGGVYSFFNTTTVVERSTINNNTAADVGGGLRTLGDVDIVNSTISGNVSTAWHGGALFATDGTATIASSTIVGNTAPGGTAGGLMVATFGEPVSVSIVDNVIADNGDYNCQVEGNPAAAVLTSLGGNVVTDSSCAAVAADQVVPAGAAGVDPLDDNGGPTQTHALQAASPAIDAAVGTCPATDQRGVVRPQGASCDVGSYERE